MNFIKFNKVNDISVQLGNPNQNSISLSYISACQYVYSNITSQSKFHLLRKRYMQSNMKVIFNLPKTNVELKTNEVVDRHVSAKLILPLAYISVSLVRAYTLSNRNILFAVFALFIHPRNSQPEDVHRPETHARI